MNNPFQIYCTSPNVYLWKDEKIWRSEIVEKFWEGHPMIQDIINHIKAQDFWEKGLIIYASYGMGKSTSILMVLDYIFTNLETIYPIYIYLHNIPKYETAIEIIDEIILQILLKIHNKIPKNIQLKKEYLEILDEIFQNLNKKLILFIDEFDVVQTLTKLREDRAILAKFLFELQNIKGVNVIIFTIEGSQSYFRYQEIEKHFIEKTYGVLTTSQILGLLEYYEKNFKVAFKQKEILVDKIKAETNGGVPRFISKLLKLCWKQSASNDYEITLETINKVHGEYWKIDNLPDILNYDGETIKLNQTKKLIIKIIFQNIEGKYSAAEICEKIEAILGEEDITVQSVAANLRIFVNRELILAEDTTDGPYNYSITENFLELIQGMI